MLRLGVVVMMSVAGLAACKKKSVERPAALEILSADVEGGKNLTIRFVLLDDKGKREKRSGKLSVSYWPESKYESCTLLGDPIAAAAFVDDPGGPIGVSKRVLTENCVARDVPIKAQYTWTADELDDGLPISVSARKVVLPTFLGGTGAPIDENAQPTTPPQDAVPISIIADITAELTSLLALIPQVDPKLAADKCSPEALAALRLADYDLVSSLSTGTPVADLELLRRTRREGTPNPREALSDEALWKLGLRKWGLVTDAHDQELADELIKLPQDRTWGFIRTTLYRDPHGAAGEYLKYVPGALAGAIFVVDPRAKKIICRAPLAATMTGTVQELGSIERSLNSTFMGNIRRALDEAKVAMGAPPPPPADGGLPALPPTDGGL
jgi:hypothetical protein